MVRASNLRLISEIWGLCSVGSRSTAVGCIETPLSISVLIRIPADAIEKILGLIDIGGNVDVGVVCMAGVYGSSHIGPAVTGGKHQLLDCPAKLFRGTVVSAGQFTNCLSIAVRVNDRPGFGICCGSFILAM